MDRDQPPYVRNDNEYLALQQQTRAGAVVFRNAASFRPLPSPDPSREGVYRTYRGREWVDRNQKGDVIATSHDQAV